MSLRNEIPQWVWYNGALLFQLDEQLKNAPEKTLSDFFTEFKASQNFGDFDFYHSKNQGTIFTLLYGLLVVPKEIWELKTTNFNFETKKYFNINIPQGSITTLDFLRLMRNSIAHANYDIDIQNQKFLFYNSNSKGERNFETEIAYADIALFITEIGKYYINEVKQRSKASL